MPHKVLLPRVVDGRYSWRLTLRIRNKRTAHEPFKNPIPGHKITKLHISITSV